MPRLPAPAPATPSAYVTAQDKLWKHRDLRVEGNLPSREQIVAAAGASEAQIRRDVAAVDARLGTYRQVHRVALGAIPEGGLEIEAWLAGKQPRKVVMKSGSETWQEKVTYYYAGGRAIARTAESDYYSGVIASRYAGVSSRTSGETLFLEENASWDPRAADYEDELRLINALLASPDENVESRSLASRSAVCETSHVRAFFIGSKDGR